MKISLCPLAFILVKNKHFEVHIAHAYLKDILTPFKEVSLTPSKKWHSDPNEKSLIGCSIRFCSFERAGENVWHVLDVAPNSPAEMAGIIPHSDYIIGSPHMTLRSEDDFYALVEEYLGKPLRLYLYNSEWDSCREVR